MAGPRFDILEVPDAAGWRTWLEQHHDSSPGVALALAKRGRSTVTTLTYEQAMEEALAFGWIDSTAHRLDDHRFIGEFTPRKRGSHWARSNKARVERLLAEGRMAEPGLAKIEAAKRDGSWNALDDVEDLNVPEDLKRALEQNEKARIAFEAMPVYAKKMVLYRIHSAKRPETRARRIEEAVRQAEGSVE